MAGNLRFSKLRHHLVGTGVALVGSVAFTYLPNTLGVKYAKQYLQMSLPYCKNVRAEPDTFALLNEVIQDINAKQETPVRKDGIEFLQTNNLYPVPFHKGNSSTGSFIGFPIGTRCNAKDVFFYHSPDNVSLEMAEFCLLSKEAKKFLFAREIYYVEDSYVLFRGLLGASLVVAGSVLHLMWNKSLNSLKEMKLQIKIFDTTGPNKSKTIEEFKRKLEQRAWRQRRYTFFLISIVFIQLYRLINNYYNWELEKCSDEKVASLGPEYKKGGLEYYQKLLEAAKFNNRVSDGSYFDKAGNLIQGKYPIFFKHVPYTQRYSYFATLVPLESEQVFDTNS